MQLSVSLIWANGKLYFANKNKHRLSKIFHSFADGGHGSGFAIKDDRNKVYIITNKHVVNKAEIVDIIMRETERAFDDIIIQNKIG